MEIDYAVASSKSCTMHLFTIPAGTVFEAIIAGSLDKLFIKGNDVVISLSTGLQWDNRQMEFRNYREVKAKVVVLDYK